MSLGNTILKYRKELGVTQESLAQQLQVTNQAVSKWESDQCCPDVQLLPQLADIFGITLDELFGRKIPETSARVVDGLPWPDDGNLRGVLFHGRTLIGHGKGPKLELFFKARVDADVYTDFSVVCGDVDGDVSARGYIQCAVVSGDVDAGTSVQCETVGGDVNAGTSVHCETIGGDVSAGASVTCSSVGGCVNASGGVKIY